MKTNANEQEMRCPKCGKFSLHSSGSGVQCRVCGYELKPGEVDKYRLFQLLREEGRKKR
ncbi:MAG: hypothetical protein LYZ69_05610 [Nitrososphaerales archaeon]|nr:hypothetical protein [Nitrososphaerales archaeon]